GRSRAPSEGCRPPRFAEHMYRHGLAPPSRGAKSGSNPHQIRPFVGGRGKRWIEADRTDGSRSDLFRGTFEHAIDAKGRTSLPAKFREVLAGKYGGVEGQTMVIAPSPVDPCLRAYPMREWEAFEETLAGRGNFD